MIEIKLSQGAKPGHGGVLPGPKVTAEIAEARGVPEGVDCVSPARHSAFDTPIEMMQFIEKLRVLSGGKPVGFKLCIGHPWEWFAIAKAMQQTQLLPDFIVVDGGEGGTGAAPLEFIDHVGAPLQEGLLLVHNTLVGLGLRDRIKIGAAGKVVSAFDIARLMALGADWCNAAQRLHVRAGLYPGAGLPHRRLPDRRSHARPAAAAGAGRADQGRSRLPVPPRDPARAEGTGAGRWAAAPAADHRIALVKRVTEHEVKLLAGLLPFVQPGALLAAERGEADCRSRCFASTGRRQVRRRLRCSRWLRRWWRLEVNRIWGCALRCPGRRR